MEKHAIKAITDLFRAVFNSLKIVNDPAIGVEWPIHVAPVLSAKDEKAPLLKDANLNFTYGG